MRPRFEPFPSARGSRECRVHAAPAVSCAIVRKENAHEHTGKSEHSGIPCAMALRLMPCSPRRRIRLASVVGELAADRTRSGRLRLRTTWHQPRVSGPHGLPYALAPFVLRVVRSLTDEPPCDHARVRRSRVHHIPSRVRDDRDAPLLSRRDNAEITPNRGAGKRNYICAGDWTTQITIEICSENCNLRAAPF